MIKNKLYNKFLMYLKYKQTVGTLSESVYYITKMSQSSFDNFLSKYNKDHNFKKKVDKISLIEMRDIKINKILNNNI